MSERVHVLLVEDNPGDADLTCETLRDSAVPCEVSVVGSGAEALDFLFRRGVHVEARPPDVVVLDLNLPRMDGKEVLRFMREDRRLRTKPVIVLTSSDAERDIRDAYELGANCYVTKPVDLYSFQATIRAIESFWFQRVALPR